MKNRILWIDLLRVIGMIGVIMIHIVGNTINTFNLTGTPKIVYHNIELLCYFSVPLFVMLSGMYFLNKDISLKTMLKKYCLKILLIILIFGSFFSFLELMFTYHTFNLKFFGQTFYNIITANIWDHMWYLYMILGLYLITPFIRIITKNIDIKSYQIFLIILFLFTIFTPELEAIFNLNIAFDIPISTGFLFFYIYSAYLTQNKISSTYQKLSIILGLIAIVIIVFRASNIISFIPISYTSISIFLVTNMIYIYMAKNRNYHYLKI